MSIETRVYSPYYEVEIRSDEGEKETPFIAGIAAPFNKESRPLGGFVEQIAPGAFERTLKEQDIIFALWSHDKSAPLGSTRGGKLILEERKEGLSFELDATRLTPQQLDAVMDGDMRMSFGFQTRAEKWEDREGEDPLRTLVDVDLMEISLVTHPAYEDTSVAKRHLEQYRSKKNRRAMYERLMKARLD